MTAITTSSSTRVKPGRRRASVDPIKELLRGEATYEGKTPGSHTPSGGRPNGIIALSQRGPGGRGRDGPGSRARTGLTPSDTRRSAGGVSMKINRAVGFGWAAA